MEKSNWWLCETCNTHFFDEEEHPDCPVCLSKLDVRPTMSKEEAVARGLQTEDDKII